jgi:hypothetical protein
VESCARSDALHVCLQALDPANLPPVPQNAWHLVAFNSEKNVALRRGEEVTSCEPVVPHNFHDPVDDDIARDWLGTRLSAACKHMYHTQQQPFEMTSGGRWCGPMLRNSMLCCASVCLCICSNGHLMRQTALPDTVCCPEECAFSMLVCVLCGSEHTDSSPSQTSATRTRKVLDLGAWSTFGSGWAHSHAHRIWRGCRKL